MHLTEHSGILDHLLPGDITLGFTIHESAGLYCDEVKLPPFTRGKKQLSKAEIDHSRQLSQVRIHVERVIRLVCKIAKRCFSELGLCLNLEVICMVHIQ